jgi:hypothetical protein
MASETGKGSLSSPVMAELGRTEFLIETAAMMGFKAVFLQP